MQYNKKSRISTADDVRGFFNFLVNERKVNLHPDDRFEDYLSCESRNNMFSQEECAVYNRLMDESFEVCEKNGADIYAIGLGIMQKALA